MKNKDIKAIIKIASKSYKRALTVIFIFLIALWLAAFGAFASSSIRVENCNMCEEYSAKLGEEINDYIKLDSEPTKTVSTQVTTAINQYRKQIIDLQSHSEVEKRSLENEILLSYTKGNTAGEIAWIYYYNIYTFYSNEIADKISAKYAAFCSEIDKSTQYSVLSAQSEVFCNELNRLIFTERALSLGRTNDSLVAASLISGAIEEFKQISSPDLFGVAYKERYDTLISELGLQRVRDALTLEIEEIFPLLAPNESFSTSPSVSLLIYELKSADSVKKMNQAAIACIESLISPSEQKKYSYQTKRVYLSAAETAASRATEISVAASFEGIFDDYLLDLKRSEVKDSIYILLLGNGEESNEALIALETKYNGKGGIIDSCLNAKECETALIKAKADFFLQNHKTICDKTIDNLSEKDEDLAKKALIDYSSLEENVKAELLNAINLIAEKYNIILAKKITALSQNDTLFLDLSEIFIKEINSVSRNNIDDFYNIVSRIPSKAVALRDIASEYREILSKDSYSSYEKSEADSLFLVIENAVDELSKIDPADVAIYEDEISDIKFSAIRSLNAIDQSARVRIETRGSKNPDILKELNSTIEKIHAQVSKSEMIVQANRGIYKIQRLLCADEIYKLSEANKQRISSSDFLTEKEKSNFKASIDTLKARSELAKSAENISALELIWENFNSDLARTVDEALAIELSRVITEYEKKLSELQENTLADLKKLTNIEKSQYDEFYNKTISVTASAKEKLALCKSLDEVIELYEEAQRKQALILKSAETVSLEGYKAELLKGLNEYENIKSHYSDENYNKILEIKSTVSQQIKPLQSKSECDSLVSRAKEAISKINNLLDDAKADALSSLLTLLEALKKEAPLYSSESFASIEGFYEEGKLEIQKLNDIAKLGEVKETLAKYTSLIKGVKKDSIYTSKDAYSIATPSLRYPDDFDFSNGLLGSVHLSSGLISNARLSIKLLDNKGISSVEKALRRAAKNGSLVTYTDLSEETKKMLRSAAIAARLDISLSSEAETNSLYTLQMLIPNELLEENILGLAFVNGDIVEFYPTQQADSLLCAKLAHFSEYYIVVESTLNLRPLLIALIFLLIGEFLVLGAILYLKFKRKSEGEKETSNLPINPMSAILPISPVLTKIHPENGLTLAILLGIAALTIGATIVLLVKKESEIRKNENAEINQRRLKAKKEALLLKSGDENLKAEDKFFFEEEVLCSVGESSNQEQSLKKVEVDLAIIAESFECGEEINLQALKSKGIVSEDANYLKVLSKGSLTKPLSVEANEFSNAAKEILKHSGGEAKEI